MAKKLAKETKELKFINRKAAWEETLAARRRIINGELREALECLNLDIENAINVGLGHIRISSTDYPSLFSMNHDTVIWYLQEQNFSVTVESHTALAILDISWS